MRIEEQYRTIYFTEGDTLLELTINQVQNTFDFQSPGQEMIKLKSNDLNKITETISCLTAALEYLKDNTFLKKRNAL